VLKKLFAPARPRPRPKPNKSLCWFVSDFPPALGRVGSCNALGRVLAKKNNPTPEGVRLSARD
jgi:hypothetical protein